MNIGHFVDELSPLKFNIFGQVWNSLAMFPVIFFLSAFPFYYSQQVVPAPIN